jgi:RNA polymerase nonessential primary-like sigma factor
MNQSRTIRLPVHVVKELNTVLRTLRQMEARNEHDDHNSTAEKVAHILGKPVEEIRPDTRRLRTHSVARCAA